MKSSFLTTLGFFFLVSFLSLRAQDDFSKVEIKSQKLSDNIYMFEGSGGNIGVVAGEDGFFIIDDQFAPLTKKIKQALKKISNKPVKFLLNTHWHYDHTGGNENFGASGAVIVAHENVRKRLSVDQFIAAFNKKVPATKKVGLPIVSFTRDIKFHLNNEDIEVFHVQPAHTDGDSVVRFRKANVIHTGDIFFNGIYPFIDASSGGKIDGMIKAAETILSMCNKDTKIIPGHGPLAAPRQLKKYIAMLKEAKATISQLKASGKTRKQIVAANPLTSLNETWGGGFLSPDQFVGIVFDSL